METKVVAITGASNGMGYEAVQLFAKQGWQVFAGARRVEKIPKAPQITALKLDVTDTASNHTFVQQILEKAGRIDVLINNAGYGEFGAAEEVSLHAVRQQFEINFFGAVELTQLVLPTMHQQTSGRIINISSIVGDIYLPLGAYYNASKAALQQWSNVLDLEISPFGLRSIVVQPGDTISDWGTIAIENAQKICWQDQFISLSRWLWKIKSIDQEQKLQLLLTWRACFIKRQRIIELHFVIITRLAIIFLLPLHGFSREVIKNY